MSSIEIFPGIITDPEILGGEAIVKGTRIPVALILGHHGPCHSCDLIGERDRGNLRWPPRQQCSEPGPMFGAMDFGIADHCQRASRVRRDARNHRDSSLHYMTFVPYPGNAPAVNALLVSM